MLAAHRRKQGRIVMVAEAGGSASANRHQAFRIEIRHHLNWVLIEGVPGAVEANRPRRMAVRHLAVAGDGCQGLGYRMVRRSLR